MSNIFNNDKDLTVHKNIRIKESLSKQIEKIAEKHNISYSKVINTIVEDYFKNN